MKEACLLGALAAAVWLGLAICWGDPPAMGLGAFLLVVLTAVALAWSYEEEFGEEDEPCC